MHGLQGVRLACCQLAHRYMYRELPDAAHRRPPGSCLWTRPTPPSPSTPPLSARSWTGHHPSARRSSGDFTRAHLLPPIVSGQDEDDYDAAIAPSNPAHGLEGSALRARTLPAHWHGHGSMFQNPACTHSVYSYTISADLGLAIAIVQGVTTPHEPPIRSFTPPSDDVRPHNARQTAPARGGGAFLGAR